MGTLSRDFGQVCWQTFGCPADGLLSTPHIDVLVYDRRVTHVSAPSTRNQRWNAQHSKQSCGWYAQGGSAPVQACNRQMPQQSTGLQSFLSATQRIVVEAVQRCVGRRGRQTRRSLPGATHPLPRPPTPLSTTPAVRIPPTRQLQTISTLVDTGAHADCCQFVEESDRRQTRASARRTDPAEPGQHSPHDKSRRTCTPTATCPVKNTAVITTT